MDYLKLFITKLCNKNLTWVRGADRKFHPEGYCLASRGYAEWCKTVIARDGIFYPHRTLIFDSFSCIPFYFKCFILKVTFITTYNDVDIGHFLNWRHWRQPNDKVKWRPIQPMQTDSREIHMKIFFLGWDNMGEIRISIPSENFRFPYPVCKNWLSQTGITHCVPKGSKLNLNNFWFIFIPFHTIWF